MHAKSLFLAAALLATPLAAADQVDPARLPPAVKQTLDRNAANEKINQITAHRVEGRLVYDVELERRLAPNARLRIAEDGQLLFDTTNDLSLLATDAAPIPPVAPKTSLAEVPRPVQETIQREAAGRAIGTIEREEWNNQPGYRVTLREPGRNSDFYVADDGSLLRPDMKPPALFLGTHFEETPAAVQQAIRREAHDGEIVKIDRQPGRHGEPSSYRVEFKDQRGVYHVRFDETGQVLENTRAAEHDSKRG